MSINPNALKNKSDSTRTFLTALAVNSGLLLVEIGAFLLLKERLWRIYSPRTHLPPPQKRAGDLPRGLWSWLPTVLRSPTKDIIYKNGLDAYMFLRFLKMLMTIFVVFTLLTFAVIIPVNSVNIVSDEQSLERVSWVNINLPKDQERFSAHIVVTYVLTFFVLYMIRWELQHFVEMRHEFLTSKSHSRLAQARTVLITSIPDELASERELRKFASFVPGGVDRVWLFRDTHAMNDLFEERQELCEQLEAAESEILQLAMVAWKKRERRRKKAMKRLTGLNAAEKNATMELRDEPSRMLLDELVPERKRPKHRVGWLKWVGLGREVDTIEWCGAEIKRMNVELQKLRDQKTTRKFLGSAFIRCNLQLGAHVLGQCVSHHEPLMMYDKWMEANPKDIVWRNLDDGALEMRSRFVLSWAGTFGLIVAWAAPTSFIGALSDFDQLCRESTWLGGLCELSPTTLGIIQGVLPPALLAAIFALLPFILRGLAWYECIPRWSLISVSVYKRFFIFLLVHGFLISTFSASIPRVARAIIQNPTDAVQQLAKELPGASTFFLTYMVTQGLAGAGNALAQFVPLVLHFFRKWFLGRTPRQAYEVTFLMPGADFGVLLPRISLLATIGFAYSVLSPIINLIALLSFSMFYLAWKFLFLQVFDQRDELETGGLYFPMAVSNLFVGLYIEQVCLACLFFLKSGNGTKAAVAQGGAMLALVGITAVANIFINHSYDPITKYLPMSLATKQMEDKLKRRSRLVSLIPGAGPGSGDDDGDGGGDLDLFSQKSIRNIRKRIKKTTKKFDKKFDETFDALGNNLKSTVGSVSDNLKNTVGSIGNSLVSPVVGSFKHKAGKSDEEVEHFEMKVRKPTKGSQDNSSDEDDNKTWNEGLHRVDSKASSSSKLIKSNSSSSKAKLKMRVPVIDAPTVDDDSDDETDDENAFDHPATYVDQPWIWIPKDPLGLSGILADELKASGVDASDLGATMDYKGIVEVTRGPPDVEWTGGHDA